MLGFSLQIGDMDNCTFKLFNFPDLGRIGYGHVTSKCYVKQRELELLH